MSDEEDFMKLTQSYIDGCSTSPPTKEDDMRGRKEDDKMDPVKGCFKKNFTLDISIISPAINKLEGWDILDLKGGIHSSVLSTKTLLYDIRKPRCKQIKM